MNHERNSHCESEEAQSKIDKSSYSPRGKPMKKGKKKKFQKKPRKQGSPGRDRADVDNFHMDTRPVGLPRVSDGCPSAQDRRQ
jgi:hypothetical protein